jgi:transposase, IS605 orfB
MKNSKDWNYRRQFVVVKRGSPLYKEIDSLCFKSKNLFNATLYDERQTYFNTGKFKFYNKVNKEFTKSNQPDYRALPAKVSKHTQMKVDQAIKSFLALKKIPNTNSKPNFPKYLKKDGRFVVEYERGALSFKKKGFIRLSKTNISISTKLEKSVIQQVRLIPRTGYYLIEVLYRKPKIKYKQKKLTSQTKFASIDLGLNNLATVTSNVFEPLIINGSPIKKY